jgi:SAM-dependent methyltransferase
MKNKDESKQSHISTKKNAEFFLDEYESYKENVATIDTYQSISSALSERLRNTQRLLDVGNGGVFAYDTTGVREIIGLDLFLDDLPKDISLPKNVTMVQGSALDIPKDLINFDKVVVVMLIHHLIGKTVPESIENIHQLFSEVHRVLQPGGKLVIVESCIPTWFFLFEKLVFIPASFVIEKTMKHPPTLQYPENFIRTILKSAGFSHIESECIPKGKYVMQYGVKVPSWVTPVQPVLFVAKKL